MKTTCFDYFTPGVGVLSLQLSFFGLNKLEELMVACISEIKQDSEKQIVYSKSTQKSGMERLTSGCVCLLIREKFVHIHAIPIFTFFYFKLWNFKK